MRTPQSIKDQEFQAKFRGFDPIEVKAYLDEIADDLFELYEEKRRLEGELQSAGQRADLAERECESQRKALADSQNSAGEIEKKVEKGYQYKDEKIAELQGQLEEERSAVAAACSEKESVEEQLALLQQRFSEQEQKSIEAGRQVEKWQTKCSLLEEQLQDAQKEDFDFKTTLVAAQKFAQELKINAEDDAKKIVAEAEGRAEQIRQDFVQEQQRLQQEITDMTQREGALRQEFQQKLEHVLQAITIFSAADGSEEFQLDLENIDLSLPDVDFGKEE